MSKKKDGQVKCKCGQLVDFSYYSSVNINIDPDLKQKVMERKINHFECNHCGYNQELVGQFLYHDMTGRTVIAVLPDDQRNEEVPKDTLEAMGIFLKLLGSDYQRQIVYGYDELFELLKNLETKSRPKQ